MGCQWISWNQCAHIDVDSIFCFYMGSVCTVNIRLPARNHLGIEIVLVNVLCGSLETILHAWKLFILVLKVFAYFCLRTENRVRKTHIFRNRNVGCYFGVGWGGVDVNVPCTSYIIVCYAAEIFWCCFVTCYYAAWGELGWGEGGCKRSLYFVHVLQRWPWKKTKTHLKFSKAFNIRKLRGTVVKSPFLKKNAFLGARFPVRRDVFVY